VCREPGCTQSYAPLTGDSSLAYHVVRDHPALAEELGISHSRKRGRTGASASSASSSWTSRTSSSPPPLSPHLPISFPPSYPLPPPLPHVPAIPVAPSSAPPVPLPSPHSLVFSPREASSSGSSTTSLVDDDEPSILNSSLNTSYHSPLLRPLHKKVRQSKLDAYVVPLVKESVAYCFAECFAVHNVPFSLASSPLFHKSLLAFRQTDGSPPERRELAVQVFDNVRAMKPIVVARLRACSGVTVGMDGWTNVRHEKVINLVPVADGVAFYWDSVVLKKGGTAKQQLPLIAAGLDSILREGVVVVGVSSDNEGTNYALFALLVEQFKFLIHSPCAAHTIQLCVKYALALPSVADALEGMDALLRAFDSSKALRRTLEQLQATLRPDRQALKTVAYNSTRWSSRLHAAKRLLLLKTCIVAMLDKIILHLKSLKRTALHRFNFDESWWHMISSLCDFLTPYQIATDIVQADSSCLMDVYYQFLHLGEEAEKLVVPHPLAGMRQPIIDIIRLQWYGDGAKHKSHVNQSAIIMCAVFSFDSEYDRLFPSADLTKANEWFRKWATEFVLFYNLSYEKERSSIEQLIFDQYNDFIAKQNAFQPLDDWLHFARSRSTSSSSSPASSHSAAIRHHRRWDPRPVWRLTSKTARELTACALALLSLTASEAAVERTFSKQGLVHTQLRNALSSESVQAQMFIAFNHTALHRKDKVANVQGAWVDLSEDIETRPRARGIFLNRLSNDALVPLPDEPNQPAVPSSPSAEPDALQEQAAADALPPPEVAAEEEKAEREGKENAEEEEEEDEMEEPDCEDESPEQRLQRFIVDIIARWRISKGFRFNGDKLNELDNESRAANLGYSATYVKDKIGQYLRINQ
jgi:hypothetical protein